MQAFLLVDDTDPAIQYVGMEAGPLSVLPAHSFFNDTFHHLCTSGAKTGASISFNFSGTEVLIGGMVARKDDQQFSPRCNIDGKPSEIPSHSNHVGTLCVGHNLSDEMHTIEISIPATNSTSQLRVDFIQYLPSSPTSSRGTLFTAGNNLTALGVGWDFCPQDPTSFAGSQTNVNGADININATGGSFTFFGCPSDGMPPLPPASVVYTIDGQSSKTIFNNTLILFDAELEYGNHQITVKYGGSSSEMPLTFCGYTVSNGALASNSGNFPNRQTTSLAEVPTMTSRPTSVHGTPTDARSTEVAIIIAGTVGGIILLFLFGFIFRYYRQHRRDRFIKLHSDECGKA